MVAKNLIFLTNYKYIRIKNQTRGNMVFQEVLHRNLVHYGSQNIHDENFSVSDFSERTINGFYKYLVKIILHAEGDYRGRKKKPNERKFWFLSDNGIYASVLRDFKKNQIAKTLSQQRLEPKWLMLEEGRTEPKQIGIGDFKFLFARKSSSSYHANNSTKDQGNGYTHSYNFENWIKQVYFIAERQFSQILQHQEKYGSKDKKYAKLVKYILSNDDYKSQYLDSSGVDYIKVNKSIFFSEFQRFRYGCNEQFGTYIKKVICWDKHSVYLINEVARESLDGLGRVYTTIGSLNKEFRYKILKGHREFDFGSSIQVVLLNLYYMGLRHPSRKVIFDYDLIKKDFPLHYSLITDKDRFRHSVKCRFSTFLNPIDIDGAKKIITQMTMDPNYKRVMGKYSHKDSGFKKHKEQLKLVKDFCEEAKIIREKVLSRFYYQNADFNYYLVFGGISIKQIPSLIDDEIKKNNKKLKGKGRGKKKDNRILFHLYCLFENILRNRMIEFFEQRSNGRIYQIHDCVIVEDSFNQSFNIKDLTDYIYDTEGFNVKISHKQY